MDEQCIFPKATDKTFVEKINSTHQRHSNFGSKKTKKSPTEFTILHYAGEVTYNAENFLEKNKDNVHPDLQNLMEKSTTFLKHIFLARKESKLVVKRGTKSNQSTVTIKFRVILLFIIFILQSNYFFF